MINGKSLRNCARWIMNERVLTYRYTQNRFYNDLFAKGLEFDGTPELGRKARFYNLIQFYRSTFGLNGETAEAGCMYGLSSFLMCSYEKARNPDFTGNGHHIFDSFKWFKHPTEEDTKDIVSSPIMHNLLKMKIERADYTSRTPFLEKTKRTLSEFPDITYNVGWIPEVFQHVPERNYRFVHVDVDLFEVTYASLEYFYPRLVRDGILVCDDYGALKWPGAKAAVDNYCDARNIPVIELTTGNAIIIKKS